MSVFERTARPHSPQSALTLEWRCSRRYELTGASARSASWARPEWLLRLADAGNGITLAIRRLGRVDSGFPDRVISSRKRGAPGRRSACMVVRRFSRTASAGFWEEIASNARMARLRRSLSAFRSARIFGASKSLGPSQAGAILGSPLPRSN